MWRAGRQIGYVGISGATQGDIAIALSGGSTPQRLYQGLGPAAISRGDALVADHTGSGATSGSSPMATPRATIAWSQEALLSRVPIPASNIHAIQFEGLTPETSALAYERELQGLLRGRAARSRAPPLRHHLAGPGGQTGTRRRSFPAPPFSTDREHWAAAVIGAKAEPRITLTYPVLGSSRHTAFLVEGAQKRAIFSRLRSGDQALPAARLAPSGEFRAFADAAAADGGP